MKTWWRPRGVGVVCTLWKRLSFRAEANNGRRFNWLEVQWTDVAPCLLVSAWVEPITSTRKHIHFGPLSASNIIMSHLLFLTTSQSPRHHLYTRSRIHGNKASPPPAVPLQVNAEKPWKVTSRTLKTRPLYEGAKAMYHLKHFGVDSKRRWSLRLDSKTAALKRWHHSLSVCVGPSVLPQRSQDYTKPQQNRLVE